MKICKLGFLCTCLVKLPTFSDAVHLHVYNVVTIAIEFIVLHAIIVNETKSLRK